MIQVAAGHEHILLLAEKQNDVRFERYLISICHNGYFQEEEKLHEISFDDTLILTEAQNMGETIMDALIGELSFINYK